MKEDFLSLVVEGGALSQLHDSVEKIRNIILQLPLNDQEISKLGHRGLPGEYGNGLCYPYVRALRYLDNPGSYSLEDGIQVLLITLKKHSQFSLGIQPHEKGFQTIEEAIPTEIQIMKDWIVSSSATQDLLRFQQETLLKQLNIVETSFGEVLRFRDQYFPKAQAA